MLNRHLPSPAGFPAQCPAPQCAETAPSPVPKGTREASPDSRRQRLHGRKPAAKARSARRYVDVQAGKAPWIAPDDALPEHPSVVWRKRHFPRVTPEYSVNSILTVMELVALGMGVGILPMAADAPGVAVPAPGLNGVRTPGTSAFPAVTLGDARVPTQHRRSAWQMPVIGISAAGRTTNLP